MLRPDSSDDALGLLNSSDFYSAARDIRAEALNNQLTRLENQDCINAYATVFMTQRGSLILVGNYTDPPSPFSTNIFSDTVTSNCVSHPYYWICYGSSKSVC